MAENESANQNLLAGVDPRLEELARQRKAKSNYDFWVKWCEKNEIKFEKQIEHLVPGSLIRAAMKVLEAKRKLWKQEQAVKLAAIAYAVEHKEILTDNYWQTEHKAFEAFLAAEKIYNVILEIEKENENEN